MCLVRFATLFLKLNQVAKVAFAEHHSMRNFVERVHAQENQAFSQTWWMGWVGREKWDLNWYMFCHCRVVTANQERPVRDVGVSELVSVSSSLSYPFAFPISTSTSQLLSYLLHHHHWYAMEYVNMLLQKVTLTVKNMEDICGEEQKCLEHLLTLRN